MDIITYILSPLPYSVGRKLFIGPAHTREWGGIMQEWEYQEEGIMGATLAHPPNRVIRMLKALEIMEYGEHLRHLKCST